MTGQVATTALRELPSLVEGGEAPPPEEELVEEEFDLADILAEDVAETVEDRSELLAKVRRLPRMKLRQCVGDITSEVFCTKKNGYFDTVNICF